MPQRPSDVLDDFDGEAVAKRVLQQAATQIGGTATTKFMRAGGTNATGRNTQTGPGSLRRQDSRLARSLLGARNDRSAPEGVFELTPLQGGARLTYGTRVEYAATHEYGDRRAVTARQEAFFWHRHIETGDDKWKWMALSDTLTYPERPFLRPALKDQIENIRQVAENEMLKELARDASS